MFEFFAGFQMDASSTIILSVFIFGPLIFLIYIVAKMFDYSRRPRGELTFDEKLKLKNVKPIDFTNIDYLDSSKLKKDQTSDVGFWKNVPTFWKIIIILFSVQILFGILNSALMLIFRAFRM